MNDDFTFDLGMVKHYLKHNKRKILKQIRLVIPYAIIYIALIVAFNYFNITTDSVRATFAGKGAILIPIFIGLQLLAALTPLPDLPFTAAGILFFQPWFSFLLVWFGMWVASTINFFVARRLGRQWVQEHYPGTSSWIDRFSGKYGVESVIVGRSFTFVTFDLVAYAAGISSMTFRTFGTASVIGLIPVALNSVLLGLAFTSAIDNILYSIVVLGAASALAIGLGFVARKYRLRQQMIAERITSAE